MWESENQDESPLMTTDNFHGIDRLVFILDVNPDYQPRLVERARLFAAVNTLDGDKKRGLLLIE
jgi:hypothetical protein